MSRKKEKALALALARLTSLCPRCGKELAPRTRAGKPRFECVGCGNSRPMTAVEREALRPSDERVALYDQVSSEIRGLQTLLRTVAPGVFAEVIVDDVGLQWDGMRVIYASLPLLEAPGETRLELRPHLRELERAALRAEARATLAAAGETVSPY